MCMVSVIYSMFEKQPDDWYTSQRIELFYALVAAAEIFDDESGQPDCLDYEKAKLLNRIDKLEEKIIDDYRGADCD